MKALRRFRLPASGRAGEAGFTLVELLIAVALLGIGTAYVTSVFLQGYRNWKRNFDDLLLQRAARLAMGRITQVLREASPGSVVVSTPAGMPRYSQIAFTDGRSRGWVFTQVQKGVEQGRNVYAIKSLRSPPGGASTTDFMAEYVETLSFVYPSLQDTGMIDVGISMKKTPYAQAMPIFIQLVERVMIRNP